MESTIKNKKIQYLTTNIRGYNCKTEYIEGMKNVCAVVLYQLSHNCSGHNSDDRNRGEIRSPDITDKTF